MTKYYNIKVVIKLRVQRHKRNQVSFFLYDPLISLLFEFLFFLLIHKDNHSIIIEIKILSNTPCVVFLKKKKVTNSYFKEVATRVCFDISH